MNQQDGNRPLAFDRETLGRLAREAWLRAVGIPLPAYGHLDKADREAWNQVGEAVARWALIGDAARVTLETDLVPPRIYPALPWYRGAPVTDANWPDNLTVWHPGHDDGRELNDEVMARIGAEAAELARHDGHGSSGTYTPESVAASYNDLVGSNVVKFTPTLAIRFKRMLCWWWPS